MKMEVQNNENEQFITKLGEIPVVNSAWTNACDLYQKTKESNGLIRATCNMAEGGVQTVVTKAMPLVEKYQPQISQVNAYACEKLAVLEETYPTINKPTEELLKDGKDKCAGYLKPVTDRYNGMVAKGQETVDATKGRVEAVKEYGWMTVNKSMETPVGRFAMEKMNEALTLSEEYIEKYLPPDADAPEGDDQAIVEKAPLEVDEVSTLTRVTSLSTKLRQRMYKRAMKDLKGLQVRSKEKLENLNFTVDLIQYAKTGAGEVKDTFGEKYELAQQKVTDLWEQINAENTDDELPTTFEGKTIVVARRLTLQMKTGISTVSGYLPSQLQPEMVKIRLENARKYSDELYQSFKQAQGFDDLPSWLLTQAREKMSYMQETVSFITDTFVVAPIHWLVPARSVEPSEEPDVNGEQDMEMEPIDTKPPRDAKMQPIDTKPPRDAKMTPMDTKLPGLDEK